MYRCVEDNTGLIGKSTDNQEVVGKIKNDCDMIEIEADNVAGAVVELEDFVHATRKMRDREQDQKLKSLPHSKLPQWDGNQLISPPLCQKVPHILNISVIGTLTFGQLVSL